MRCGASVGPYLERISDLPDRFEFVEVSIGEGEIPPDEIDREQLRGDLDDGDLDLTVHLPFRQPLATTVDSLDRATREYQSELLDVCADLGAEKAVVHVTTRAPDGDHVDLIRDRLVPQVEALAAAGEKRGVEVCFENVGNSGGAPLDTVGGIAAAADVPLCFDVANAYAEHGNAAIRDFLSAYGDRVSHLHVHDARERGDTHIPVGSGEVDWAGVGDALGSFDGTAAIEVFTDDPDYLDLSAEKFLEPF